MLTISAALALSMALQPVESWHDHAVADRCHRAPESCAWTAASPAVLDAVEHAESRGRWWAVGAGARCLGPFQLCHQFARLPWPLLFVRPLARIEAGRQLDGWIAAADGQLAPALAAYRCGWAGLRGRCGVRYAAAVLRRAAEIQAQE